MLKKDNKLIENSYSEGADNSAPLKLNPTESSSISDQMTAKAEAAINALSELKALMAEQKKGDPSIPEQLIEKVKQFSKKLIEELKDSNQSKFAGVTSESLEEIHKGQKYKNLSGAVTEVIERIYKK